VILGIIWGDNQRETEREGRRSSGGKRGVRKREGGKMEGRWKEERKGKVVGCNSGVKKRERGREGKGRERKEERKGAGRRVRERRRDENKESEREWGGGDVSSEG